MNLTTHSNFVQAKWSRIILLIVILYEALGCLAGGGLLVASPDGKYMDMPVSIMNGVFKDFLIPGILLIGLGILNSFAFISVLRRSASDWILACVGLGGLIIWFVVEIIILKELHWLHAMWALPVLLGCVGAIPLIIIRHDTLKMTRTLLLFGIISSIYYLGINILVPALYPGYSIMQFTVSELSAIGAPTRVVWVLLAMPYLLLLIAFGWGVLRAAGDNRKLHIAGNLIIAYCILNFYWPPMHMREVIAAGGGTLSDTLHIVWAMMTLLFNMLLMGFGSAALGKKFRMYTIATWAVFIVFGILTFMESPGIEKGVPTPTLGLWERINMGAFLLWVAVFAIELLQNEKSKPAVNRV